MKALFRKEALDHFSSSSGMSKGVRGVRIRTGLWVGLLVLCTGVFSLWLFFGTIYETVPTEGIIWSPQGNGGVYALSNGTVSKTIVSVGSMVQAGDILAVIPNEALLEEIQSKKAEGVSEEDLAALYRAYDGQSMVRAHISGIVTAITDENVYVKTGDQVASVVPYDAERNNKTLIGFVPARNGGLISLGMEVQVTPDFATREAYGYIEGYVSSIGAYPVMGQAIQEERSQLFLPSLEERESYLQVEITFIPDAQSQSRLKWSNPRSGNMDVAIGTMCTADIVVKSYRPYAWLFGGAS